MPSRLVIGLFLALLAGLCGASWLALDKAQELTLANARVAELERSLGKATASLGAVQTELARQRILNQGVQDGLDQAPEWRDSAVPDPVRTGLCKRVRCK